MIYFDNAATSFPKPESVYKVVDDFFRETAANPGRGGHRLSVEAGQVVMNARRKLAELFNVGDPSRIVFTSNTTEALNLAIKGLLSSGDHVVTSSVEHNSVVRPLRALEDAGIEVTKVRASQIGLVDPEDVRSAMTPQTRLIVLTHASNVAGTIQPIAQIGKMARERGVTFLVDAAQTAGILPIDVEADNIDLLAFPGHKSLYGPPGTGGLYIKRGIELRPLCEGGTGTESELDVQPAGLPERFESGTLNSIGIAGLSAGVGFVLETGLAKIRAHELILTEQVLSGLQAIPEVFIYGPGSAIGRVSTISFNIEGWEPSEVAAVLDESFGIAVRAGLHCAPDAHRTIGTFPGGSVRVSPGFFNTLEEGAQFLDCVGKIASSTFS